MESSTTPVAPSTATTTPTSTSPTPSTKKPSTTTTTTTSSSSSSSSLPLHTPYTFWYLKKSYALQTSGKDSYERSLIRVGDVHTVGEFWAIYSNIVKAENIDYDVDLFFFRKGLKPMWEEPDNNRGGKFTVYFSRTNGRKRGARSWEEMLLALVGAQIDVPEDEICGLVYRISGNQDELHIWTKHANDLALRRTVEAGVRGVLKISQEISYRKHAS
eukprot:TRINITY_DN149_c3_g1_i1.p1 TRINITY_DN149_c3_g1~~TRINITY_DN149_c3_g1_i1.p1  ORF type:complete len:216 (+),score=56.77 TRINITY_DN149_c3_g1_i1:1-648(+)